MLKPKERMVSEILIALKGKGKPEGKPESEQGWGAEAAAEEEEAGEQDEGQMAAAEELIAAVKAGDAKAVIEAFQSLKELC